MGPAAAAAVGLTGTGAATLIGIGMIGIGMIGTEIGRGIALAALAMCPTAA